MNQSFVFLDSPFYRLNELYDYARLVLPSCLESKPDFVAAS